MVDSPPSSGPESAASNTRNARQGLRLFAVYLLLYGGFVLLNALAPSVMETTIGGINLAVLYGMGLIFAAFVLSLFYAWLCRDSRSVADEEQRQ